MHQRRARPQESYDTVTEEPADPAKVLSFPGTGSERPEAALGRAQLRALMERAVAALPTDMRLETGQLLPLRQAASHVAPGRTPEARDSRCVMSEADDRAISDFTVDGNCACAFQVPLRYTLGISAARRCHHIDRSTISTPSSSWPRRNRRRNSAGSVQACNAASKAHQSCPLVAVPVERLHTLQPARSRRRYGAEGGRDGRARGLRNRIKGVVAPVLLRIMPPSRRRNLSARRQSIAPERGDPFRQSIRITSDHRWTPRGQVTHRERRWP